MFWSKRKVDNQYPKKKKVNEKKSVGRVKKKWLFVIPILFLCALTGFFVFRQKMTKPSEVKRQKVINTAKIERKDLSNSVSVTGTVASAECKSVTTSLGNLKVTEVCVQEGDLVQKGDVICRFDSSDIEEALATAQNNYSVNQQIDSIGNTYTTQYQESIEQAQKTLQDVNDKSSAAKSAYDAAQDKQSSAKENYEKAQSDLKKKQTVYETARRKAQSAAESYEALAPSHTKVNDLDAYLGNLKENLTEEETAGAEKEFKALVSAKKEYMDAKSKFEAAQAKESQAKSAYEEAKAAESQAYESYEQAQTASADAQEVYEDSVKKAGETYEKSKLEDQLITDSDEKQKIEDYEEQLANCTVYAAMSGVITSLSVEEGENFSGETIYEVQDQSHFIVEASVDEYDICDISKGMKAYVKTDSMGDTEMEGEVTYVAPVAASSSQTTSTGMSGTSGSTSGGTASYSLKIEIKETQERLRAGMTAKVSISLEESEDALAVPYDCIQKNKEGDSIVYINDGGEQKEVVVETGIETDYYTEVKSEELEEGMEVYMSAGMIQNGGSVGNNLGTDGQEESGVMIFGPGGGTSGGDGMPGGRGMSGGGMPSGGPGGF